jgi:hypothetical protein
MKVAALFHRGRAVFLLTVDGSCRVFQEVVQLSHSLNKGGNVLANDGESTDSLYVRLSLEL